MHHALPGPGSSGQGAGAPVRSGPSQGDDTDRGLVSGKPEQEVGHLHGRANQYAPIGNLIRWSNESRGRVEWIVSGAAGTEIGLTATSSKAGTVHATVTLPQG